MYMYFINYFPHIATTVVSPPLNYFLYSYIYIVAWLYSGMCSYICCVVCKIEWSPSHSIVLNLVITSKRILILCLWMWMRVGMWFPYDWLAIEDTMCMGRLHVSLIKSWWHIHAHAVWCFKGSCGFSVIVTLSVQLVFSCTTRSGRLETIKYLIEEQGCSTGCTNSLGWTPLHVACW